VINEAKQREVDRLILSGKIKKKALWNIINKETGNSRRLSNIITNTGVKIITKLQVIAKRFNIYFTEVTEDLLSQLS